MGFKEAIMEAAGRGDIPALAAYFDEYSPNVDDPSGVASTLLLHAAIEGQVPVIAWLVEVKGASLEARDGGGWAPLHGAAGNGRVAAAAFLLARGADAEARDAIGFTPMMWASAGGRLDAVRLLLRSGARVDAANARGKTAYRVAIREGRVLVAALLGEIEHCGSFEAYAREDRRDLLGLRTLVEANRALPPRDGVLAGLFYAAPPPRPPPGGPALRFLAGLLFPGRGAAKARRRERAPLPKEVFWHVLGYWRSSRDTIVHDALPGPSYRR